MLFGDTSLVTEALKKVDMSAHSEQFVINVMDASKHPKYLATADGAGTSTCLLIPIARQLNDVEAEWDRLMTDSSNPTMCVLQLRNKLPRGGKGGDLVAIKSSEGGVGVPFRSDDISLLQYFALSSAQYFEQAVDLQRAKETDEFLMQQKYCVKALTKISNMLASGSHLDDLVLRVVDEAIKLMNCDRATLFLVRGGPGGACASACAS